MDELLKVLVERLKVLDEWLTIKNMQKHYNMSEDWMYRFAAAFPEHVRKIHEARNSPMVLRRSAVKAKIDAGWGMENNGRRVAK